MANLRHLFCDTWPCQSNYKLPFMKKFNNSKEFDIKSSTKSNHSFNMCYPFKKIPRWLWFCAALSIFTFYIPLFLSGIPNLQRLAHLQHNVPVTLHILSDYPIAHNNFNGIENINNRNFSLSCSMGLKEINQVYNESGICFDPKFTSGLCDGKTISLILTDIYYERNDHQYRDTITIKELPSPFNIGLFNKFCLLDWLYDPTEDFFIDNTRTYLSESYVNGNSENYHYYGPKNWEDNQNFRFPIIAICVMGSFFGILPVCSVITLICVIYYGVKSII